MKFQALAETQRLRVTNLASAILSVYIDSASDLPKAKGSQSKPDPFAILSVGKSNQQTSAFKRTDVPVWEQGFMFLVANPENDTLQIRIVDQKTEKDLGQFTYILNTLLTKNDLQVVSQPFQLQKSGPTSKITMSLALKILKRPETVASAAESESLAIQRQASIASQASQSSQLEVAKNVKLADFPKPSEVLSDVNSAVQPIVEKASSVGEFITNEAANVLNDSPMKRHLSAQASVASVTSSSLGRIQISLSYSSERQRLIVIIHKIM